MWVVYFVCTTKKSLKFMDFMQWWMVAPAHKHTHTWCSYREADLIWYSVERRTNLFLLSGAKRLFSFSIASVDTIRPKWSVAKISECTICFLLPMFRSIPQCWANEYTFGRVLCLCLAILSNLRKFAWIRWNRHFDESQRIFGFHLLEH